MSAALSLLPVALVLLAGYAARASGLVPRAHWPGVEAMSFRLLIPALLVSAVAQADLAPGRIAVFGLCLLAAPGLAGVAVLCATGRLAGPRRSTLFQTVTRFNGFVALAAAELQGGPEAVALVAVAMALLIAPINVANIWVLANCPPPDRAAPAVWRTIASNPLVLSVALGLGLNLGGVALPGPLADALDMVGRAALGVGVLAVGAGIEPRRLITRDPLVWAATGVRLLAVPALFIGLGLALGLGPVAMLAGLLVCGVPAASNGYVLARIMGGDADRYADILAWQTVLAMLSLPLWMVLLGL